jgi:lysophospholipase L1-like esterase
MRFLALGDSYTIGEGVMPEERWPTQLARGLRERGLALDDPTLIATTGWTTDELWAGIDHAHVDPASAYDLVSLLIGVNNQYRGHEAEAYRTQFGALLARAIGFAGQRPGRVLVLSIPDWSVTPFAAGRDRAAIAVAIERFNAINRAETARLGAHYVDITPISRQAAEDVSLITVDGLHPSGKMYAEWARQALLVAEAALRQ